MTATRPPAEQATERYKSLRAHIFVPLSEAIPAGRVGTYADEITRLVKPELEALYVALLEAQAETIEARDLARAVYSALNEVAEDHAEIIGYDPRLDPDECLPYWLTQINGAPETWQHPDKTEGQQS